MRYKVMSRNVGAGVGDVRFTPKADILSATVRMSAECQKRTSVPACFGYVSVTFRTPNLPSLAVLCYTE